MKEEKSVIDKTFEEIDSKLSVLNKETIDWIKQKIIFHINEAFLRGINQAREEN